MTLVPASSLSSAELASLGNDIVLAVQRDRTQHRRMTIAPAKGFRRRRLRRWWRKRRQPQSIATA